MHPFTIPTTPAAHRGRTVPALLATAAMTAALALAAGCQSGPVNNDTMGGGSNNAGGGSAMTKSGSDTGNGGGNMSMSGMDNGGKKGGGSGDGIDSVGYFPNGSKSGEVLMVEATGPKTVKLNKEVTYTVKVTNITDNPVHNVVLNSTNPDGFQVSGGGGQPADKGMGYPVGDLAAGESKTVTITGTATKVGSIDTCYTATYNPPTVCTMVQVTNPAIALKVDAQPDMDVCKTATYTYTVTNTGTGTAHNVSVSEDLPDGLTTDDGKNSFSSNIGDIEQGQSKTATATLKATKTGTFNGTAKATADGEPAPSVATATNVHAPKLDVAVAAASPSDYVGKTVGYTITVTNTGDSAANNAKVQIGHPSGGMGTVNADGVDASSGTVSLGTLAPGEKKTVNATATSNQGGKVTVVAIASSDCAQQQTAQAETMFNTIPALLLETVDETDPVKVGTNVTYDVKVTNQGSGPDTNINVKAVIPDGEEYVSTDGPTQPMVDGPNLTFPPVATLAPKESVTWKVTVKANKAQDVQFRTSATSDGVKTPAEKAEPTKLY